MRYILLTAALALCASAFGATGVSPVAEDFEKTLCGTMPKDWWLMNRQLPTNCFRYVSNVQAVSGEKAFLNDFTGQSLAQRAWRGVGHGYLCHTLPKASNDVLVIRFCFRLEDGKFACEVRGPNAGGGSLQIPWWIEIGDTVGLKGNGKRGENPSVSVGPVRPHAWHRVTFRLPTVGSSETEAEVRLERYLGKGRFEPVGKPRRVGFGGMRLTGPYSFLAFTGYGKSRYWIDDFACYLEKEKR